MESGERPGFSLMLFCISAVVILHMVLWAFDARDVTVRLERIQADVQAAALCR